MRRASQFFLFIGLYLVNCVGLKLLVGMLRVISSVFRSMNAYFLIELQDDSKSKGIRVLTLLVNNFANLTTRYFEARAPNCFNIANFVIFRYLTSYIYSL